MVATSDIASCEVAPFFEGGIKRNAGKVCFDRNSKTTMKVSLCVLSTIAISSAFAPGTSTLSSQRRSTKLAADLWNDQPEGKPPQKDMSKSLPFAPRPKLLDGSLPGDVGFEYVYRSSLPRLPRSCHLPCSHSFRLSSLSLSSPFGFSGADKASLMYMREAEIKHSRLAMLAVLGWPLAELWDKPIADAAGLPSVLTKSGESPSVLNGGLDQIDAAYWVAVVALAGIVELEGMKMRDEKKNDYVAGDCGLSGLLPKEKRSAFDLQTKELKNGRLAMMGTSFARV
jgi:hypothetical protein